MTKPVAAEPPPNYTRSIHSIPGATGQLDNFLKWVLKENKKTSGTFYAARLHLKHVCEPVAKWRGAGEGPEWERVYQDSYQLNMDCLLEQPYIYWVEGNQLFKPIFVSDYLVKVFPGDEAGYHSAIRLMIPPHNFIDLNEDVVPTDEDVGSSSYLVSRTWVVPHLRNALNGDERMIDPRKKE